MTIQNCDVRLVKAVPEDLQSMTSAMQEAFAPSVHAAFGRQDYGPIPSDEEIRALFHAPGTAVYHVVCGNERAGGVVLTIRESGHNALEFFYVSPACHNRGLGLAAWRAVEALYPQTRVWETVTPYFEKRNIHFYVNKCGFHIVEFFNARHADPDLVVPLCRNGLPMPGMDEYFLFRKVMMPEEGALPRQSVKVQP